MFLTGAPIIRHVLLKGKNELGRNYPLLLPDTFCNEILHCESNPQQRDKTAPPIVATKDREQAESLFLYLKNQQKSNRRDFVRGTFYNNMFPGHHVIDARTDDVDVELRYTDPNLGEQTTTLRIRSAAKEDALLSAAVTLGDRAFETKPSGNCRKNAGDFGFMCALGYKDSETEMLYQPTEHVKEEMRRYVSKAGPYMKKHFPEALKDIQNAELEKNPNRPRCKPMETNDPKAWPGNCIMVSKNLENAGHFDFNDKSRSFAVWVKRKSGNRCNGWYLVFPDATIDGSDGVVIQLFHGVAVEWNGKVLRHCSSMTDVAEDDALYGIMFGSCR